MLTQFVNLGPGGKAEVRTPGILTLGTYVCSVLAAKR